MVVEKAVCDPAAAVASDAAAPDARWDLLPRLDQGPAGRRRADGAVAIRRAEPAGCFLYGPYLQLPAGWYRLGFGCRAGAMRRSAQPVLGVEVIVLARLQLAWRDFTGAELATGQGLLVFEVPAAQAIDGGNEGRFEFRFVHLGNADLTIDAVRLQPLAAPPPVPPAPCWRLLGRLDKSWRCRRAGDGRVSVGRGAPAGPLLYGGWPYLRLPRGAFRLIVAATSGAARRPGEPVFGLEILAPSRRPNGLGKLPPAPRAVLLAAREATGAEIAKGPVGLDFAVPSDLALESGSDAPFEVRLHHRGNAALRIDRVDVVKLDEAASGAALPVRLLPPSGRRRIVMIGNCQMETLRLGFSRIDALSRRFEVKYHFVQLPPNLHEFAIRDLERCDLVVVQDIRLWDEFPLRDAIRPGAETVKVPLVRFASLWPFDGWNGPSDRDAIAREAPNLTFPYLDGLLGRLRREIPDREGRFQAYRALDVSRLVNYRRLHELEERRLLAMDRRYGTAIGAYILENFRRRRIFHTTVRPDWRVFGLLLQCVADLIGARARLKLPKSADAVLRNPQVPVHPNVARDLGVRWADERTRYSDRGGEVIWETYIRRYIEHYG
ncbi:MAG TPA: WcbI family polysaccharide biosynthesis putative acetyltransferase [Stellaceae bacterium]|nr:WcbI family polysaccharide biosynthesis putative acetyltransferase [Stellaceae bacterium]